MTMPTLPPKPERDKILEEARERFKLVNEAEAKQRTREAADLRFMVPELQWSDEARAQREGGPVEGTGTTVPARPMVSIPKIHQPVQMILNQEKSSRLGVRVHPLSEKANRDTARVIQGLYRKIERDSNAHQPRSWAFTRAVEAGRGAYRVNLAYDEEGGHPFDMKIVIERILHQENVYFDPSAQQPDWSDGEWAFDAAWVPINRFRRDHPEATVSHADKLEWQHAETDAPDWVRTDGKDISAVLVAGYWYKEYTTEHLAFVRGEDAEGGEILQTVILSKGEKVPNGVEILKERERQTPTVKWVKMTGLDVVDAITWQGKYIPLIPTVGRELIPFDGERRWTGVVGPAKDAQQMYNYGASSLIELTALEPRAPWIGTKDQFEGYEAWWAQSNTRNFPQLLYNHIPNVPMPARVQIDANRLGPSMMMIQQSDEMIHSSTSSYGAREGDLPSKERSGKAIEKLLQQGDVANSDWLQNLAHVSMAYEAKVVLDLIPVAYERPGRVTEILEDEAGKTRNIMLNLPFEEANGQVRPSASPNAKLYDLRGGAYSVSVNVGKSYQSRLQEGADEIGHILAQAPDYGPVIAPTYFKFRNFPGSEQIADDFKAFREHQFPGVFDQEEGTPEAIAAKYQRLKREHMMMQQQMQQMAKQLETDAIKAKAQLEKAQIDAGSRTQVAAIETEGERVVAERKAEYEKRLLALEQQFEAIQNALDRAHEMRKQAEDNASEEEQARIRGRESRQGGAE